MPDFMTEDEKRAVETYLRKKRATMCPTVYVAAVTGAEPVKIYIDGPKSKRRYGATTHNANQKDRTKAIADMHAANLGPGIWSYPHMLTYARSMGVTASSIRRRLRDCGYDHRIGDNPQRRKEG